MPSNLLFPLVVHSLCAAHSDLDEAGAAELVATVAGDFAAKHPDDFERFYPGMEYLSRSFFASYLDMGLENYLETLYCAVKHSEFARPWRAQMRQVVQKPVLTTQ